MSDDLFTADYVNGFTAGPVGIGSIVTLPDGRQGRVIASQGLESPWWVVKVHISGGRFDFVRLDIR